MQATKVQTSLSYAVPKKRSRVPREPEIKGETGYPFSSIVEKRKRKEKGRSSKWGGYPCRIRNKGNNRNDTDKILLTFPI